MPESFRAVGDGHIAPHSQVDHVDDNANEGRASRESTPGGPGSSQQASGALSDLAAKEKRAARQKEMMEQFRARRADVDRKLQARMEGATAEGPKSHAADDAKSPKVKSAGAGSFDSALVTRALEQAECLAKLGNIEMDPAIATQIVEQHRIFAENAFKRPENEMDEPNDAAKAMRAAKAVARGDALLRIDRLEAPRRQEARSRIDKLDPPVSSTEEAAALTEALSDLDKEGRIDRPTCNAYFAELHKSWRLRPSDPDVEWVAALMQTVGRPNAVVVDESEVVAAREDTRARAGAHRGADANLSGLPTRNNFRTAMNRGPRSAAEALLGPQTALPTEVSGRIRRLVSDDEPVVDVGAGGARGWTLPDLTPAFAPWLVLTANQQPARRDIFAARLRSLRVGQEGGAAERTQPLRADEAAQILGQLSESVAPEDMRGPWREYISNTERRAEQPIGNPGHITAEQEGIAQRLDRLNEMIETVPPQMRGELRELISDRQRRDEQPTRNRGRITMAQVLGARAQRFATPRRPTAGLGAQRPETANTQLTIVGIDDLDSGSDWRDVMRTAMAEALDGPLPRAEEPQSDDDDQGARRT